MKAKLAGQPPAVSADVWAWLKREAPQWGSASLLPGVDRAIGHAKAKLRESRKVGSNVLKHDPDRSAQIMEEFEAALAAGLPWRDARSTVRAGA